MHSSLLFLFVWITDIGDSSVLVTLTCLSAFYLWDAGARRDARILLVTLILTGIPITALKILLFNCRGYSLHSPSGHAALSVAVLSSYAALLLRGVPRSVRAMGMCIVPVLLSGIAVSRVLLGVHTRTEVLVGLFIACIALMIAQDMPRDEKPVPFNRYGLLYCFVLTLVMFHGVRMPSEWMLHNAGRRTSGLLRICAPLQPSSNVR